MYKCRFFRKHWCLNKSSNYIKKDACNVTFTDAIVVDNFNGVIKNNAIMPSEDNLIDEECLVEKESSIQKIKSLFK